MKINIAQQLAVTLVLICPLCFCLPRIHAKRQHVAVNLKMGENGKLTREEDNPIPLNALQSVDHVNFRKPQFTIKGEGTHSILEDDSGENVEKVTNTDIRDSSIVGNHQKYFFSPIFHKERFEELHENHFEPVHQLVEPTRHVFQHRVMPVQTSMSPKFQDDSSYDGEPFDTTEHASYDNTEQNGFQHQVYRPLFQHKHFLLGNSRHLAEGVRHVYMPSHDIVDDTPMHYLQQGHHLYEHGVPAHISHQVHTAHYNGIHNHVTMPTGDVRIAPIVHELDHHVVHSPKHEKVQSILRITSPYNHHHQQLKEVNLDEFDATTHSHHNQPLVKLAAGAETRDSIHDNRVEHVQTKVLEPTEDSTSEYVKTLFTNDNFFPVGGEVDSSNDVGYAENDF